MHPTPDEQLQAIERRLEQATSEQAISEPALTPAAREAIDDARRLLRRLQRAWAQRLPFLALDNRLAIELLTSLAPKLTELSAEIEALAAAAAEPPVDEPTAHELNKRLQGLLGRAVHLLPDGPDGDAGRARIADHLRSRIAADPALNRTPTARRQPPTRPLPQPQEEQTP